MRSTWPDAWCKFIMFSCTLKMSTSDMERLKRQTRLSKESRSPLAWKISVKEGGAGKCEGLPLLRQCLQHQERRRWEYQCSTSKHLSGSSFMNKYTQVLQRTCALLCHLSLSCFGPPPASWCCSSDSISTDTHQFKFCHKR